MLFVLGVTLHAVALLSCTLCIADLCCHVVHVVKLGRHMAVCVSVLHTMRP